MLPNSPSSSASQHPGFSFDPNFSFEPDFPQDFDFGPDINTGLLLDFGNLNATSQSATSDQHTGYNTDFNDYHPAAGQEPEDEFENNLADTTICSDQYASSSAFSQQLPAGTVSQHDAPTPDTIFPPSAAPFHGLGAACLVPPVAMPDPLHPMMPAPPPTMVHLQHPIGGPDVILELERRLTRPIHMASKHFYSVS